MAGHPPGVAALFYLGPPGLSYPTAPGPARDTATEEESDLWSTCFFIWFLVSLKFLNDFDKFLQETDILTYANQCTKAIYQLISVKLFNLVLVSVQIFFTSLLSDLLDAMIISVLHPC